MKKTNYVSKCTSKCTLAFVAGLFIGVVTAKTVWGKECPKGYEKYKDTCVALLEPEIAQSVKPSDEKPPTDKMPSYQREGIQIVDAPNVQAQDEKDDLDKMQANREGKKAAGIK